MARKPIDYAEVQQHAMEFVTRFDMEIERMEEIAAEERFPIIGPVVGEFCYQVARMSNAKRIFELGSGYGYSTAWFAKALEENNGDVVHHTVWDHELSQRARLHLKTMDLDHLVQFHDAEALSALQKTDGEFDIIFMDVDKKYYPEALPLIEAKIKKGGVLIVDNMLLRGRIFDPQRIDPTTDGVREFAALMQKSSKWNSTLVPIRDGVLLSTFNVT
jgi:predicted O-methyltransferase YrrM